MACFSPNYLLTQEIDKKLWLDYKFQAKDTERHKLKNGWSVNYEKPEIYMFLTSKYKDYFKVDLDNQKLTPLPCGCCIGCRLDYSKEWAARCLLEAVEYKDNYFLTLTYDNEHLPKGKYENSTLVPDDLKSFMNKLRTYMKRDFNFENIRFYACGEYGEKSFRPHYHILLFNCPILDLDPNFHYIDDFGNEQVVQHVYNGSIYYYSDYIHKIWGKGNIVIGRVEWQSCAYVSRYISKKLKGNDSKVYDSLGIEAPFCRMSLKPGIGFNYFNTCKDEMYKNDNIILPDKKGVKVIVPPRYYDKMLKVEDYLTYLLVKQEREKKQAVSVNTIYHQTNLHYDDYLSALENQKNLQISSLKRII